MAEGMVQALDRGLEIMRLLAEEKIMTATAIASRLGIHQSSASRLLNSLVKGGMVRKPDYHSFALDYGTLVFAGRAMDCFPAIGKATAVCNQITRTHGFSATIAILKNEHLLYLTRTNEDSSLVLIDNPDWPLSRSVPGLILACEQGQNRAVELLTKNQQVSEAKALELYELVQEKTCSEGLFYMEKFGPNIFNGGISFQIEEERAALAVFSSKKKSPGIAIMREILEKGRLQFNE